MRIAAVLFPFVHTLFLLLLCLRMFAGFKVMTRGGLTIRPCSSPLGTISIQAVKSLHSSRVLASSSIAFEDNGNPAVNKAKVIFVLGGPGSGKGTQSEKLASEFGISHLSAGELLRQEISTGSEQGKLIDSILKEGRIVPVAMSLSLLRKEILQQGRSRYIIDGFPRNYDNIDGWQRMMPTVCDIEMILFLECKQEEMERRILERGLTSNRADDNLETARKRFVTFQRDSMPVIDYYATNMRNKLILINGDRSIEAVYADVKSKFESFLKDELIQLNRQWVRDNMLTDVKFEIEDEHATVDGTRGEYNGHIFLPKQTITLKRNWKLQEGKWVLCD